MNCPLPVNECPSIPITFLKLSHVKNLCGRKQLWSNIILGSELSNSYILIKAGPTAWIISWCKNKDSQSFCYFNLFLWFFLLILLVTIQGDAKGILKNRKMACNWFSQNPVLTLCHWRPTTVIRTWQTCERPKAMLVLLTSGSWNDRWHMMI